ncbi:MAG: thioredoxin domain-containing protein [Chloroflexi bacterium]|nr:thioredoxin domain-containing protein [Chloroflexota bacterium]
MSRSRTIERKKEREKAERQQRQRLLVAGLAAVAVVVVVIIILSNLPADAPIPEYTQTRYQGLEVSQSSEGYPRIGNPNAPVVVKEYSSFDCPHCKTFHDDVLPGILERVRSGDVQFIFVPLFGTGGIANGEGAAYASVCALQQGGFWPFHDALFDWQGRFVNQAFTQARMGTAITSLGMDRGAFDACLRSGTPGTVTQTALAEARTVPDFTGTPFVTVNGVAATPPDLATINQTIDQALILARSAQPTPVATTEATTQATTEATNEATQAATTEATTAPTTAPTSEPTPEATP